MTDSVTLTIDGQQITVPAGLTVVDAARRAGIEIPVFCYHPKMEPVGMCRMCLVEIGRPMRDRATGEFLREEDGSIKIQWGRKLETACTARVMEGMVVRTTTDKVSEARKAVLEFLLTSHPLDCPICDKGGECSLQNLTMAYGPETSRFYYEDKERAPKHVPLGDLIILDRERCIKCSRCIRFQSEVVDDPVLTFYQRGHHTDVATFSDPPFDSYWSGNTTDICPVGALTTVDFRFGARPWEMRPAASICTLCPVGCNLTFDVRREAASGGKMVIKRVLPRQNEQVNEIWICDKGRFAGYHFAESAERLTQPLVRKNGELVPASWDEALRAASHGLEAARGKFLALASGRLSNEDLFNLARLTDALGGVKALDSFMAGGDLTAQFGLGEGSNLADLGPGDTIVVVASDLEEEAPLWWLRVKQAAERGATLIVANPRFTKTERYAKFALRYRYGREAEIVLGLADQGCNCGGEAVKAVAEADRLVVFYGQEGMGLRASRALAHAVAHLLVKTGHAGKPGSGMVGVWPRANDQGAWDMGFRPQDDLAAALKAAKAVVVAGADPAGDDPALAAALDEADFVVVQELFLTETARKADVVFPVLAYTERGGTYTNGELRVQRFYPAVPAPAGLLADFAVTARVGERLGVVLEARSPAAIMHQIAETVPTYASVTYEKLAEVCEQYPLIRRTDLYYGGTAYENTRGLGVALKPAGREGETPSLEAPAAPEAPSAALLAVPVTRLYDRGTLVGRSGTLEPRLPQGAFVVLHPEEAARRGLADGAQAALKVAAGTYAVTVRLDRQAPEGVVLVPRSMGVPVAEIASCELGTAN